jgi:hypothetical protein
LLLTKETRMNCNQIYIPSILSLKIQEHTFQTYFSSLPSHLFAGNRLLRRHHNFKHRAKTQTIQYTGYDYVNISHTAVDLKKNIHT